jgi:hypothetical protein
MAKIPFSKLGLKVNSEVTTVSIGDYDIEVHAYLPMETKATMISNIINASADNNGYYNPLKVKVFFTLEILFNYTNLTFTAKMKEDYLKLYDIVVSSGLFEKVLSAIPEQEWKDINKTAWDTIANIYEYKNSIVGVMDVMANDYSNLNFDLSSIQDKLTDPNQLAMLKELAPMMANMPVLD